MPKYTPWRPDFEVPGPHVIIKDRIVMERRGNVDEEEPADEDDDLSRYRYYESNRIIGKLYRAIDEKEIFSQIQKRSLDAGITRASTVIDIAWEYVQGCCPLIQWKHLLDWARDIREM
jgi:hypothetical protein